MEQKSPEAFRTISEVADWLGVPTHVLRFWESRFTQVKPVKRAGGRRYYRPADMLLLGGIRRLLHDDGLTIRGVQKLLREEGVKHVASLSQPLDVFPDDMPESNVVDFGAKRKDAETDIEDAEIVEDAVDETAEAEPVEAEAEAPEAEVEEPEETPVAPPSFGESLMMESAPVAEPATEASREPEAEEADTSAEDQAEELEAAADTPIEDDGEPDLDRIAAAVNAEDDQDIAAEMPEPEAQAPEPVEESRADVETLDLSAFVEAESEMPEDVSGTADEPDAEAEPQSEIEDLSFADTDEAMSEDEDSHTADLEDALEADAEEPTFEEIAPELAEDLSEPDLEVAAEAPEEAAFEIAAEDAISDDVAEEDEATELVAEAEAEEITPEPIAATLVMPDIGADPADGTLPPEFRPVATRLRQLRHAHGHLPESALGALGDRLRTLATPGHRDPGDPASL